MPKRSRPTDKRFSEFNVQVDGITYDAEVRFLANADGTNSRFRARCPVLSVDETDTDVAALEERVVALIEERGRLKWEQYLLIEVRWHPLEHSFGLRFNGYKVAAQKDGRVGYMPAPLPTQFYDRQAHAVEDLVDAEFGNFGPQTIRWERPDQGHYLEGGAERYFLPWDASSIGLAQELFARLRRSADEILAALPEKEAPDA